MYDVPVALRRLHGLIRWCARKYSVLGNPKLSREDLEGEGLLVLVQCCQSFPDGEVRFSRYFKKAWYNRLKTILRDENRLKRKGFTVELDETTHRLPVVFPEVVDDMLSHFMKHHLTPKTAAFIAQLMDPDKEVSEYAWRDFCRKHKLYSLGQRVYKPKRFRIRQRHVRKVLGISRKEAKLALTEARRSYRKFKKQTTERSANGTKVQQEKVKEVG